MKKSFIIFILFVLLFSIVGCTNKQTQSTQESSETAKEHQELVEQPTKENSTVRIATLAGPTGMGLVNIANDTSGKYCVEVLTQPDQITPKIINGEVDIATIPSNLAAVLYNKMEGNIKVVSVNTKGVLYLLGTDESITSFSDLDGKEVYLTGQGATPEYIVNEILLQNKVQSDITFMTAHADLSNAMASSDVALGILPEPFVSITLAQNSDLKILIDLNQEWQSIYGEGVEIPMGVTVVSDEFIQNNKQELETFLSDYQKSVDYVNNDIQSAAQDIVKANIFAKASIIEKAVPRCGISFETGETAKNMLVKYYEALYNNNPKSIGGSLPSEAFYYE